MSAWVLVVFAAVFVAGSPGAGAGQVVDRIRSEGVIRTPRQPEWPPFVLTDPANGYTGFDVQVAEEIARRIGVKIEYVTNPDGSLFTWVQQTDGTSWKGQYDFVVASMTPTEKRSEHLAFPVVYYYALGALGVHRDNTTIRMPHDASGKRIGVHHAANMEMYLRRQPFGIAGMEPVQYKIDAPVVVTFDYDNGPFDSLLKGDGVELDAIVSYLPALTAQIKQGKPLKVIGGPLYYVPQSIAIAPGDAELASLMTDVVTGMHKDGTLSALSLKWMGLDMTRK